MGVGDVADPPSGVGTGITEIVESTPTGRRGAGTTNHCMHGKDAIVEEILDWRPFDYLTSRSSMPDPSLPKIVMTDTFIPLADGGTRVEIRVGKVKPRERATFEAFRPMLHGMIAGSGEQLRQLLSDPATSGVPSTAPEPARNPRSPRPRGVTCSRPEAGCRFARRSLVARMTVPTGARSRGGPRCATCS